MTTKPEEDGDVKASPKEEAKDSSEKKPPKAKKVEPEDDAPPRAGEAPDHPPAPEQPPPPPYAGYHYGYQPSPGIDFSPVMVFVGILLGAILILVGLLLVPGFATSRGVYYAESALIGAGTFIGFLFAFCGAFFGRSFNNYHRIGLFIVAAAFLI